jgi:hypothetical protein
MTRQYHPIGDDDEMAAALEPHCRLQSYDWTEHLP